LACVFDTKTNLYWEVKTEIGVHGRDNEYGYKSIEWDRLINASNNEELCGFSSGWHVPLVSELRSIVDRKKMKNKINEDYFPNTRYSFYWSSSPYVYNSSFAWSIDFHYGADSSNRRSSGRFVRLVRVEQ